MMKKQRSLAIEAKKEQDLIWEIMQLILAREKEQHGNSVLQVSQPLEYYIEYLKSQGGKISAKCKVCFPWAQSFGYVEIGVNIFSLCSLNFNRLILIGDLPFQHEKNFFIYSGCNWRF